MSTYMVFVREKEPDVHSEFNAQDESKFQFLNKFKDCFAKALPEQYLLRGQKITR